MIRPTPTPIIDLKWAPGGKTGLHSENQCSSVATTEPSGRVIRLVQTWAFRCALSLGSDTGEITFRKRPLCTVVHVWEGKTRTVTCRHHTPDLCVPLTRKAGTTHCHFWSNYLLNLSSRVISTLCSTEFSLTSLWWNAHENVSPGCWYKWVFFSIKMKMRLSVNLREQCISFIMQISISNLYPNGSIYTEREKWTQACRS